MEITRDVILDLMPLYLADEVSEDTRALVEKYLKKDPELAEMAEKRAEARFPGETTIPLKKEDKMQAYLQAKRLMYRRTFIHATIIICSIVSMLALAIMAFYMVSK